MLAYKSDNNMDDVEFEQQSRPPRAARTAVRRVSLVLALVAIVGAVLFGRGWRPNATDATSTGSVATSMPTSAAIEATYGIRFTSVDVTAAGGMIQLQYQVLDSDKALAVHDAADAPFVIGSDGVKYADPGMVGHTHVGKERSPGSTDYILLADAKGGMKAGSIVTIRIGNLELHNVHVL